MLLIGPTGDFFKKTGFISANHENADEALRSGGVVVVFPGGDYDVYRPTMSENKIDFGGRTGYVKAALNAGVPIVPDGRHRRPGDPAVPVPRAPGWPSASGRSHGWPAPRSCRSPSASRSVCSLVVPPNVPLPAKIVMQVLPPIDIVAEFGEDPDIDEVDAHVRHVMQRALDELAARTPAAGARLTLMAPPRPDSPTPSAWSRTMARAGMIAPLRPDKYLRIAAAMRARKHVGTHRVSPPRRSAARTGPASIDELGTLTWREIDQRARRLRRGPAGASRRRSRG